MTKKYLLNFKQSIKSLLILVVIFLFIFGTQFKAIAINSSYLVLFGLIILNPKKVYDFFSNKEMLFYTLIFLIIGFYSLLLSTIYGFDNYFLKILVGIVAYILFGYLLASNISHNPNTDRYKIYKVVFFIVMAISFNSLLIILEYFNNDFKYFIENIMVENNMSGVSYLEHPFRIRGLATAGGAALSVVIAFGILMSVYLYFVKYLSLQVAIVLIIIMNISNIFTGRTGLFLGLIFSSILIILLFYKSIFNLKLFIKNILLSVVVITLFLIFLNNYKLNDDVFSWAFEIFINFSESGKIESSSSNELLTMFILPDDISHLLFGIGFYEGNNPLNYIRSDVGYIKSIFSIGLLLSIFIYGLLFNLIYKLKNIDYTAKLGIPFVILLLMLIELKEPFLYQNYLSRVIFCLVGAYIYLNFRKRYITNDL